MARAFNTQLKMIRWTGTALLLIGLIGCGPTQEEYINEVIGKDLGILGLEYDVLSYDFDRYENNGGGVTSFRIKAYRAIAEVIDLCDELHGLTESGRLSVAGCEVRGGGGGIINVVYTASDSTLSVAKQELF